MGPGADQGDGGNDEGKPRHRVGEKRVQEVTDTGDAEQAGNDAQHAERAEDDEGGRVAAQRAVSCHDYRRRLWSPLAKPRNGHSMPRPMAMTLNNSPISCGINSLLMALAARM